MFRAVQRAWSDSNVVLLHDRGDRPTRAAVVSALQAWRSGGKKERVFHFSGHGTQVEDLNGDEADGLDEAICPLDFESEGVVTDDELHALLPEQGTTLVVLDCCHSGTGVDLPYRYDADGQAHIEAKPDPHKRRRFVVALSGCGDAQESDATKRGGLMTQALLDVTDQGAQLRTLPLFTLLERLRHTLKDAPQHPQLCSNHLLHRDATLLQPRCTCCSRLVTEV